MYQVASRPFSTWWHHSEKYAWTSRKVGAILGLGQGHCRVAFPHRFSKVSLAASPSLSQSPTSTLTLPLLSLATSHSAGSPLLPTSTPTSFSLVTKSGLFSVSDLLLSIFNPTSGTYLETELAWAKCPFWLNNEEGNYAIIMNFLLFLSHLNEYYIFLNLGCGKTYFMSLCVCTCCFLCLEIFSLPFSPNNYSFTLNKLFKLATSYFLLSRVVRFQWLISMQSCLALQYSEVSRMD